MSGLPRSNLHLDVLMGRDEAIEPVDVFGGKVIIIRPVH
jgi:proteasome maturation protein